MPGTQPEDTRGAPRISGLAPWLLLTGSAGATVAALALFGPEPPTVELHDMPERFVGFVAAPAPAEAPPLPPARTDPPPFDPREKSKLLLKLIGTTGESGSGPGDLWSDAEIGLPDLDVSGGVDVPRDAPPPSASPLLSTFSIDVDTASWSLAYGAVRTGRFPTAVRLEEFVNAFTYDYDPPTDGRTFQVHALAVPSPWTEGEHLLRIGLQAVDVDEAERTPAHLTFLVDTSGSMRHPDKLDLVRASLHTLVDHLRPDDTVAIVTYAGDSRVVVAPTPARQRTALHAAVDTLSAGGRTAMAQGIYTAYQLASESFVPGHVNRVIVASDGDANIGPSDPEGILPAIREYADDGITLTTLGFGSSGYDDHMMEQLADRGDGAYVHIGDRAEADRVLGVELTSTLQVVARDVKVQVAFDPAAVTSAALVGYDNRRLRDEDFADDAVDAGEVGAGHQVTALYRVVLRDSLAPLGEVRLRYQPVGPGLEDADHEEIVAVMDRPLVRSVQAAPASLRKAVAVAGLARILSKDPGFDLQDLDVVEALAKGSVGDDPRREQLLRAIAHTRNLPTPVRR